MFKIPKFKNALFARKVRIKKSRVAQVVVDMTVENTQKPLLQLIAALLDKLDKKKVADENIENICEKFQKNA